MPWLESVPRGRPSVAPAEESETPKLLFFRVGRPEPNRRPVSGPLVALSGSLASTPAQWRKFRSLEESELETNQPAGLRYPRNFRRSPSPRRFETPGLWYRAFGSISLAPWWNVPPSHWQAA